MKDKIRKEILEKRNNLSKEKVKEKSEIIINKLLISPEYKKASKILFYHSTDNEVFTHEIIKSSNKEIFIPKVKGWNILCCKYTPDLEKSKLGIMEPRNCEEIDPEKLDLIIVPGVAFDINGNRIGFGGGYYDNLLKLVNCPKIALAYDFQIIDEISPDSWDQKVDKVITDK